MLGSERATLVKKAWEVPGCLQDEINLESACIWETNVPKLGNVRERNRLSTGKNSLLEFSCQRWQGIELNIQLCVGLMLKKKKAVPEECLLWRKLALNKKMNSLERNRVRHLLNSWLKEEWYMRCCFQRTGLDSYLDGGRKLELIWRTDNLENTSMWQKTKENFNTKCW